MIKGFIGTSLVDYPGKVASVIFTGGCNLRCPYCYNIDLVVPERLKNLPDIPTERVKSEISRRKGFIDAIVITGGEPLLHPDLIKELASHAHKENLLVKIDTNGTFPEILKELIKHADFIAMDVKTSPEKYPLLQGSWQKVKESLKILKKSTINYEIRITAVPGIIEKEDILALKEHLKGVKRVVLQKFVGSRGTLDPQFEKLHPFTREEMEELASILKNCAPEVVVR